MPSGFFHHTEEEYPKGTGSSNSLCKRDVGRIPEKNEKAESKHGRISVGRKQLFGLQRNS